MIFNKRIIISVVVCSLMISGCGLTGEDRIRKQKAEQIVSGNVRINISDFPIIDHTDIDLFSGQVKGVRDFIWCLDEEGNVYKKDGWIGYANVFTNDTVGPQIYRFTFTSENVYSYEPIVLENEVGIDELGNSIGSVIKTKSGYRLYYSGLTEIDGRTSYYTYNVAFSQDGLNFERYDQPLLYESDFDGIQHIGLPYTCFDKGVYYMTCESIYQNEYSIYGAYSSDGIEFKPINKGKPVLCNDDIAWGNGGCANPKLFPIAKNEFLLGFNAFSSDNEFNNNMWKIGAGIISIFEGKSKTIKICDKWLIDHTQINAGRIESAVFTGPNGFGNDLYFFTIPSYDATEDAAVYNASLIYP